MSVASISMGVPTRSLHTMAKEYGSAPTEHAWKRTRGAVQIAQKVGESHEKCLVAEKIRDANMPGVYVVEHCSRSPDVRTGIAPDADLSKRRSPDPEAIP